MKRIVGKGRIILILWTRKIYDLTVVVVQLEKYKLTPSLSAICRIVCDALSCDLEVQEVIFVNIKLMDLHPKRQLNMLEGKEK